MCTHNSAKSLVEWMCIEAFLCFFDGLLHKLIDAGYGCYIGHVFAGVLAYADDVVLLAPSYGGP